MTSSGSTSIGTSFSRVMSTRGKVLDKEKVIKTRMLEMDFFKKMGVHKKVDRGEVKKNEGKIVSTKWVDTDKATEATRRDWLAERLSVTKANSVSGGFQAPRQWALLLRIMQESTVCPDPRRGLGTR